MDGLFDMMRGKDKKKSKGDLHWFHLPNKIGPDSREPGPDLSPFEQA